MEYSIGDTFLYLYKGKKYRGFLKERPDHLLVRSQLWVEPETMKRLVLSRKNNVVLQISENKICHIQFFSVRTVLTEKTKKEWQ